ncbi:MAG TPA: MFS transporter [Thermoanaerobaculia bacterium]|jgi:EmrB/QacA subfamily drug resistance transporter|nr:MFS transporter [Thermoanaerobaculia bacterium]
MAQPLKETQPAEQTAETSPPEPTGLRKWGSLFVLSLALAIIIIDTTLLNVSLETLIRELHTNLQSLQWVISAYSLTLAALTVTGGRMGDLFGRKRMFMLGAFLFAVGSFIASISQSVPVLLLGESIVEGIGAALMMPATAALLVAKYRGHDRAIAFGIWGASAAAASAVGPVLGGYLTTHYSWRWGFRINVFVVALLLLGSIVIRDEKAAGRRKVDGLGVFLSGLGLFSLVFGIIEASSYGWIHALKPFSIGGTELPLGGLSIVPFAILFGLLVLTGFAFWEQHVESAGGTPIVSLRLFKNANFVAGAAVIGIMMLSQNGLIFSLPVFLQSVRNLDAFHTGMMLLPLSAMLLLTAPTAAQLTKRIDHKRLVQAGLVLNFVALLAMRQAMGIDTSLNWLIPGLALYGIGMGLVQSQINNLTLSAVAVEEAGEASGVSNTFRQVGLALGSAIIGSILLTTIVTDLQGAVRTSPRIPPAAKQQVEETIRQHASSLAFSAGGVFDNLPPTTRDEMAAVRRVATTDGNRKALLWGAGFVLLCLVASNKLPQRARESGRDSKAEPA